MYIANQEDLEAFVKRAKSSSVLAIDTEFLREKTYYAKLCLLQMATDSEIVIVDPFSVSDLTVLEQLFRKESITALFHAGNQDLEILLREVGSVPRRIFDTQIAAALLGHTQQIGYGALVHSVCGVNLRKMDSYTDWSRRPLSESQLEYAGDDVRYLPDIYRVMVAELEEKGRLGWLDNEFAELSDTSRYVVDPSTRFRRLKRVTQLSRKQLSAAREAAAWREKEAQRRDVPRKWIMSDEQIVEACKREASTLDELFMVRGIKDRVPLRDARGLLEAMRRGLAKPQEQWPDFERCSRSEPNVDAQVDLMNALVRLRARENGIAMQTLASHDDMERMARGYTDVEVLRGWRRVMVGDELEELLKGRLTLRLDDGGLVVERR